MDGDYSDDHPGNESIITVEVRETHPLLNDSDRSDQAKPSAPIDSNSEPGTSASAFRRHSNNSIGSEDVTDNQVITAEPISSTSMINLHRQLNESDDEASFSRISNHNQLKSKFDTDEPDPVEGYTHKICCSFIQCCAIFIEG